MQRQSLSEAISHHLAALRFDAIPSDVIQAAKRLMLDTLAVAWAGSDQEGIPGMRQELLEGANSTDCTVWGVHERASRSDAALLNSASAAALDFDGLHLDAVVHPDIVSLPALLAVAERGRVSGQALLTSLVGANDLSCRLAMSTGSHTGWFYTSIHGVFGAAGGCAKVLELPPEAIRNALGLALSQASGTQQPMVEKSLNKRVQSAFASRAGVLCALLAAGGMRAPTCAFEGDFGFYRMYESGDPSVVLQDLGLRFEGVRTSIKKWPSCGCNHVVIQATLDLVRENQVTANDVVAAQAIISPYMFRLVGAPYDPTEQPTVAAQFSVQYSMACALLHGHLGIADIQADAAREPAVVALANRVEVVVDETNSGQLFPAQVTVTLRSGKMLSRQMSTFPGSPQAPISDSELAAKVHDCMGRGTHPLSRSKVETLMDRILNLDKLPDVSVWSRDI